jgi:polar amino acid transport system substrate-binding protein
VKYLFATLLCLVSYAAFADDLAAVRTDLAPTGKLRAAINFGNSVLAQRDPATSAPRGISADLSAELSRRLGVPLEFVIYSEAGDVAKDAEHKVWDVGFLAIDPKRAATITFTPPYVLIEGAYLVSAGSKLATNDDIDRPGIIVGVAEGSAYDLYLSRTLHEAALLRERNAAESIASLRAGRVQVVGGVKIPLDDFARTNPDVRVIPGHFMLIEQAMITPQGHDAGAQYLTSFIEEMKASGFVADALKRSGQTAASVAPPAK